MSHLYGLVTQEGFERLEVKKELKLKQIEQIVAVPGKKIAVSYLTGQFSDKYIKLAYLYDDDCSSDELPVTCITPDQIRMQGDILVTGSDWNNKNIALTEKQFEIAKNELILVSSI